MTICLNRITSSPVISAEIKITQKGSSKPACTPSGTNHRHRVKLINYGPCRVEADVSRDTVGQRIEFESKQTSGQYVTSRTDNNLTVKPRKPSPFPFSSPSQSKTNFDCGIKVVGTAPPAEIIETEIDYRQDSAANPSSGKIDGDIVAKL